MGQCCKCGRETPHEHEYYEGEKIVSDGGASCANMGKCSDFMCSRCVLMPSAVYVSVFFLFYLGLAIYTGLNLAIHVGHDFAGIVADYWWLYAVVVWFLGLALSVWIPLLLDKRLPFKADTKVAAKIMTNTKRKQTPEKTYLTPHDYKKYGGGPTP